MSRTKEWYMKVHQYSGKEIKETRTQQKEKTMEKHEGMIELVNCPACKGAGNNCENCTGRGFVPTLVGKPNNRPLKVYNIKLTGVAYKNEDGGSRQELLAKVKVMDTIDLVRDPKNEFDMNAIKVLMNGKQIGFIPKGPVNYELANLMDHNFLVTGTITGITGKGLENLGCNVSVFVYAGPDFQGDNKAF